MRLAHLRARSFRNLEDETVTPGPGVTVLYGDNAQGKTNLLEAVYLLSNLQSFRTRKTPDLVRSSAASATVQGSVEGLLGSSTLRVRLDGGGRSAELDGKPAESIAAYLERFPTVLFCPLDLDLARGSQDLRRRYLDRAAFVAEPGHLDRLRQYNRAIKQRNSALRSGGDDLGVWDEEVALLGAAVHQARVRTLGDLTPEVLRVHRSISGAAEQLELEAVAAYARDGEVTEGLRRALAARRPEDQRRGFTSVGPHRDAVRLRVGEREVERYGSQGQMRTVALALKLGLLGWATRVLGDTPVFLLDDPGSELDDRRLAALGEFLAAWPGQVLVAATARDSVPVPCPADTTYYRVSRGSIEPG